MQQHQAEIAFNLVLLFSSCLSRELFLIGKILSKGKFVFEKSENEGNFGVFSCHYKATTKFKNH